jgi:hypothetical protein
MYVCVALAAYANPCGCVVSLRAPAFLVMDVSGLFLADVAGWRHEQKVESQFAVLTYPLTLLAADPFERCSPQWLACSG